jgi:hypothetical protein
LLGVKLLRISQSRRRRSTASREPERSLALLRFEISAADAAVQPPFGFRNRAKCVSEKPAEFERRFPQKAFRNVTRWATAGI